MNDQLTLFPPVDGQWADYGPWSDCSVTCGEGRQERRRTCTNPIPQYNGKVCDGMDIQTRSCVAQQQGKIRLD